ncbi:hypothetical protein [Streptomyces sp. NBC_01530]
MRRAFIVALLTLAWMVGPVIRIQDGTMPPPAPEPAPSITISR